MTKDVTHGRTPGANLLFVAAVERFPGATVKDLPPVLTCDPIVSTASRAKRVRSRTGPGPGPGAGSPDCTVGASGRLRRPSPQAPGCGVKPRK